MQMLDLPLMLFPCLRLVVQLISIHAFCSFPLGNSLPVLLGLDRRKLYLLGFRILGLIL